LDLLTLYTFRSGRVVIQRYRRSIIQKISVSAIVYRPTLPYIYHGRDSAVGIATGYGLTRHQKRDLYPDLKFCITSFIKRLCIRRYAWLRGPSQRPYCLKALSSPARTLGSWVRIPLETWMSVSVYSVFVLFCVQVAALQRVDPPSKEPYCLCIGLTN
jgi:hypothetical protein